MSEKISWAILHPLFLLFVVLLSVNGEWYEITALFLIALAAWLSLYEIGYLENDALTIRKEKNPTLRIPSDQIEFIQQNFKKLVVVRFIIAIIGIALLGVFSAYKDVDLEIFVFLGILILARIAFTLHNTIRSRLNIGTYLMLSTTKYLSIPLLFLSFFENWYILLIVFLAFPLPRTIEHAAKIKYRIGWIQKLIVNLDLFRVCYYTLLLFVVVITQYTMGFPTFSIPTFIVFWFFAFRVGSFVLIKVGGYKRTKTSSHHWDTKQNK